MGVSKTTVHRWIVASMICVHCNSLKPILTEENKHVRFEMTLSFRDPANLGQYQDMRDRIHVDEKWLYNLLTHLMLIYWTWAFSEPYRASMMQC